jgi:HD-GYP domain-containing protein (c-di-GMP phosphodiesterase class II)
VALTRDRLAGEFRALFEGLIQLLVTAIDEKSPYTGAHCRRVPVLTEMIADAACAASEGPLKEFTLSATERYELRIAALLHDCGKVTTPVHVQDKATKLEALFDRIDLVDVRFEVTRRELELAHLGGELEGDLNARLRELDDDRAFLRLCNTGGEFMDRALQDRVRAIAARWRWRAPDGKVRPILEPDEVANLTIARGTLSEADREIVNQHVVATIQMLEQLPYPKSLRNVPFIAGCHHERMDGCGYPNHLTREQMSLQARILGLADVFEALTAKDRPYKPGLTVKTVLGILSRMRDEGHIDPDVFDVFVREKVHLRYAAQWLDPEQIDEELLDEAALALIESARDGERS